MAGRYRIVVVGGAQYRDSTIVFDALDLLVKERKQPPSNMLLLLGPKPNGADRYAREWCEMRGARFEVVHAPTHKYGDTAFGIRNQQLIKGLPDLVLAFAGDRWAMDCLSRAERAGIERVTISRS